MTAPTVTVGGIPTGARHGRRWTVLRGLLPDLPGPVPPPRGVHQGHRQAVLDVHARWREDRYVWAYQLDGRWHVAIYDGRGLLLDHLTPDGIATVQEARRTAVIACGQLAADGAAHPDRWEVHP